MQSRSAHSCQGCKFIHVERFLKVFAHSQWVAEGGKGHERLIRFVVHRGLLSKAQLD